MKKENKYPLLPLKYETWLLQMGLSLSENIHRHNGKIPFVMLSFFIPAPEKKQQKMRENIVQNK